MLNQDGTRDVETTITKHEYESKKKGLPGAVLLDHYSGV